jgi:hypothetical protein
LNSSGITWGIGPAVALPMTDDPTVGSGTWRAGSTVVMLTQTGPWTYGFLANQPWSFADANDENRPDVDRLFLQPFLSYTTRGGVSYVVNSESTHDRSNAAGRRRVDRADQFHGKQGDAIWPVPFLRSRAALGIRPTRQIGPERKLRISFVLILPRPD